MPRRFLIASILSVTLAVSTATVAGHAQTVAAPATTATGAVTQVTQVTHVTSTPVTTTQTAATDPTFECMPGIFTTICQIIFAPFCTTRVCTIESQSQAAATTSSVSAAAIRMTLGARRVS